LGFGLLGIKPVFGRCQRAVQAVANGLQEIPSVINALSGETVLKVRHRSTAPAQRVGYDTTAYGKFCPELFLKLNKEVYIEARNYDGSHVSGNSADAELAAMPAMKRQLRQGGTIGFHP
jgi:hypothetical protein